MRHVLVSVKGEAFLDALRDAADAGTTFLPEPDPEEALERLSRSARIDAVLTDDPQLAAEIRAEIPGALPVHVMREGEGAAEALAALDRLSS